jgi:hypothetical protein
VVFVELTSTATVRLKFWANPSTAPAIHKQAMNASEKNFDRIRDLLLIPAEVNLGSRWSLQTFSFYF